MDAWRLYYIQLNILFDEVEGFSEFILILANNTLRDNKLGMVFRVCVGALIGITDAATDIYVISTYYESESLYGQANICLAMIIMNVLLQLVVTVTQNKKKSWAVIFRETLITMSFIRPAVDGYKVSLGHEDEDNTFDVLSELMANKGT